MKKFAFLSIVSFLLLANAFGQVESTSTSNRSVYDQIKTFDLNGGKSEVSKLVLTRDRVELTFDGTFYFSTPVDGKVTGAVFIGQGLFKAEIPPNEFEKNNVKRLLKSEVVESDFKTAVFRFTDDTFDLIGKNKTEGSADAASQKLASEINSRILEETGANLASRLSQSILNQEDTGFFFATFDGGKRNRFSYIFDSQNRVPTYYFGINGGEKGLIFSYLRAENNNEVWLAFYGLEDYRSKFVSYSDVNDLVDIENYKMDVDLRSPKKNLVLKTQVEMTPRFANVKAIPFTIGESLGEADNQRLKKQMRLQTVKLEGEQLEFVQEDWEGGLTVFFPKALLQGQKIVLDFAFEGDFIQQPDFFPNSHYPRSNTSWYPRHGYLDRATYDMTFSHSKNLKIATVGTRQSEEISQEDKDVTITKYKMNHPVSFVTFAMAQFKRNAEMIKWDSGETPTPLEYSSVTYIPIKESFIMAELNNSVRYFHSLFGKYPYENYGAAFHPFGFGQGFPSMVMIPGTDRANKYTYAFIAHETAHQWWGNIVSWRSYRDQWLSEGFAEYSGVLYTSLRKDYKASLNLVNEMRESLRLPPETRTGPGKGKLSEVGPIILGHRLNTSKTYGAYNTLVYNKGGLVLRMLHFLFTDPNTGEGDAFFAMMKDFVEQYRNKVASTDDFMRVANEHFVNTPIAQRYKLNNLNWFFRQWVYQAYLPTYSMDYTLQDQPDGTCLLSGTVMQENAPEDWSMVLPVFFSFGSDSGARTTIVAIGSKTNFSLKLPRRPKKVELDPQNWILSEKTKTN